MERLRCVVERITYQNVQNGYSVIKCRAKGYSDCVIEASLSAWFNQNTNPHIRFFERGETQCSRLFFTRIYIF